MCFGYEIFATVGKFSSNSEIIDKDYNRIYTLSNLDKATPEEIKILRGFEQAHLISEDRHAFTNYEELENYESWTT